MRLTIVTVLAALLLGSCIGPQGGTPVDSRNKAQSENASALRPFFSQLARLEGGGRQPLHILQIGDSHTAADFMSGRVRDRLQSQFGASGRGLLPPGLPYRGIRQAGFSISAAGRWDYENSLNSRHDGPFGIAGFNATSRTPGAAFTLDSDAPFDRLTVSLWQRHDGGRLDVEVDGKVIDRVDSRGDGLRLLRYDLPSPARQLRLLAAERRPVTLLDYGIESRSPGIVYDALGVVGGTVTVIERWDGATIRAQIAARQPALIVLAFGTNEGYADSINEASYASRFVAAIRALKSAAPNAAIAVIGPPDVLRAQSGCRPATQACAWSAPEALARVSAIQRSLAVSEGFFFWDWRSLMLASGGMANWADASPPLARPDRVHLTVDGYALSAEGFHDALMQAYRDWRAGRLGS